MSASKTEAPTQKKLRDARERGDVGKSREFGRNLAFLAFVGVALGGADSAAGQMIELIDLSVALAQQSFAQAVPSLLEAALIVFVRLIGVPLGVMATVLLAGDLYASRGLVLAPDKLTLKFDTLNPLNGLSNWFSLNNLMELLKSLVKIGILGCLCTGIVMSSIGALAWSAGEGLHPVLAVTRAIFSQLLITSGVCFVLLALFDNWLQTVLFQRKQRMSKEEVKTEHKQAEGDPEFKQHRKREFKQLMRGDVRRGVRRASVVITNPTHLAVAVRYVEGETPLPVVTAMGADRMAQYIRQEAARCGVPVIEQVPLARALWLTCELDEPIPMEFAEYVAAVLASIEQIIAEGDAA